MTVNHLLDEVVTTAARHAEEVDRDGRFPSEAIEALKESRLMGLILPRIGASPSEALKAACSACCAIGRVCSSTGLIYAMHLSQVACLAAAARSSAWHAAFLEAVDDQQLLLASITSEAGVGGDIRTSSCALEISGSRFQLQKEAPTASYAVHADALLITARRCASAAPSDQVLVIAPRGTYVVREARRWDTLGMRGTCSGGYSLDASGHADQVCPGSFSDMAEQVMVPMSHVLWGSVWLGIAAMAVERARSFLASKARGAIAANLPIPATGAMLRLERAAADLRTMEARLCSTIEQICRQLDGTLASNPASISERVAINGLKITLSDMAVSIVQECLRVCGTEGYRNDSQFALGRQLRDVLSAPLMVSNDRIAATNSQLALVQKTLSTVM
jgi:acyl-CoA dehydrogenase